jgi:hypothetical protein
VPRKPRSATGQFEGCPRGALDGFLFAQALGHPDEREMPSEQLVIELHPRPFDPGVQKAERLVVIDRLWVVDKDFGQRYLDATGGLIEPGVVVEHASVIALRALQVTLSGCDVAEHLVREVDFMSGFVLIEDPHN